MKIKNWKLKIYSMSNDLIKHLRELTGAGILDVKQALVDANGDKDKAIEILRKKGVVKLGKKAERTAREGIIVSYIHPGAKLGVLLELNCETDFVARTDDFKNLAKELAMHIAATNPVYVSIGDVPADVVEKEKEIYRSEAAGKPATALDKIIEGKLAKFYEEVCLAEQPFIKNPEIKIRDLIAETAGKVGENVVVRRFARFVLGS